MCHWASMTSMRALSLQIYCFSYKTVMIPNSYTFNDVVLKDLILVILLHNKLPPNAVAWTPHLLSHSFYGSVSGHGLSGSAVQGLTRLQSRGQSGPWSYGGLTGEASTSKLTWLLAAFSPLQVVGLGASVSCWVPLEAALSTLSTEPPLEGSSQHGSLLLHSRQGWDVSQQDRYSRLMCNHRVVSQCLGCFSCHRFCPYSWWGGAGRESLRRQ